MSSNQPPAKENTTASNGAISRELRPRKTTNATIEKSTAHDGELQLSNNNEHTGSTRTRSSTDSCSIAKKIKSNTLSISKSDDDNMAWVVLDFPLGSNGDRRTVSVPEQHASWQAMIDASNNPYCTLLCLSRTNRILNGGSPPMILDALMLDDSIINVCLLQETSLRRDKQDRGIIVVGLPAILRSLASFKTAYWSKAADGELCAEWNDMMKYFGIDITGAGTCGAGALKVDWMKQVFYYRSKLFIRDNSAAISKMVGSKDNYSNSAVSRPTCNDPTCNEDSVERGYCEQHLPKKCPFCDKNNAGGSATFECRSCNMRRHNKVYSCGSLLTEEQLKEKGIWNPNPGTLTKELAQKKAKRVAKK